MLVALNHDGLAARLGIGVPASSDGASPVLIQAPLRVARRGVETRLIIESSTDPSREPDPVLLSAVARGYTWFDDLTSNRANSIKQIADREGLTDRYVKRLLDLAYLPPTLVEDILEGRQPSDTTVEALRKGGLETRGDHPVQRRKNPPPYSEPLALRNIAIIILPFVSSRRHRRIDGASRPVRRMRIGRRRKRERNIWITLMRLSEEDQRDRKSIGSRSIG